jgi:predicted pyridoxine 5'-phosphate oxidase superfamily flavin-nucleotide-binding protein
MRDPFHSGERAIQELTGERDLALLNGQAIADRIPAAAMQFVTQQRTCALGGASPTGEVWASFLTADRGFAHTAEDRKTLFLRLPEGRRQLDLPPPLAGSRVGSPLAVLFLELETRRRLRVTGRIERIAGDELALAIDQANPLCPRYIQRRRIRGGEALPPAASSARAGEVLDDHLVAWIRGADTCFVASSRPGEAANVAHRGGRPGFIELREGALRIPDYPGNSLFSTLGNFALHPRAGLVFVDFAANRQLQVTGEVRLDLESESDSSATGGTGRWWELTPRQWRVSPLDQAFDWAFIDESPFLP